MKAMPYSPHTRPAEQLVDQKWVEYLLVYALIAYSTIPFFKSNYGRGLVVLSLLLVAHSLLKVLRKEVGYMLGIVAALELYHFLYFPKYDLSIVREVVFAFFLAAFCVYYLKLRFQVIYVTVLYWISIISLVVFGLLLINPGLVHSIDNSFPAMFRITSEYIEFDGKNVTKTNPIFYNFDYNFYKVRNNGPFWEPTVFASLLLIAQLFNFISTRHIFNRHGLVFTLTIITTFSTTGFIAYFIFLVSVTVINSRTKPLLKLALLVMAVSGSIYLYSDLPFLQEKINNEINEADINIDTRGDSRVAGAMLDLFEISESQLYILLGKGSDRDSRIGGLDKTAQRNCGLTGLFVEWGVLFALLYIGLIYYSFWQLCSVHGLNRLFAFPFTVCILILSFSEIFFELPLFHVFIFLGLLIRQHTNRQRIRPTINIVSQPVPSRPAMPRSTIQLQ
ncbi:hypothetical protein GCM10027578_05840 [Spirosoma luteolum]